MEKKEVDLFEHSLKLLVKTSFIVFIGILLSDILTYIFRIIIVRHYGLEIYGLFSLGVTIWIFVGTIAGLGLSDGLLRFVSLMRGKEDLKRIRYLVRFVMVFSIISGAFFSILLYLFSSYISINFFHNAGLIPFLKIFSIVIFVSMLNNNLLALLRAFEKIGTFSFIFNILQSLSKLLILLFFIYIGIGVIAIPYSVLVSIIVCLIASYFASRVILSKIFIKKDKLDNRVLRKDLLSYSFPILFASILGTLFYSIDTLSLSYLKTAEIVGLYNVAVPIAALLLATPDLFMQLFFPVITKEYSRNNISMITQLSKQVNKWILILNIPVFSIILIFPGVVLNILFGSSSLAAESALRILVFSTLISSVCVIGTNLLSMAGKSKFLFINIGICSIIALIINALLIPLPKIFFLDNSNGLIGASLSVLIITLVFNLSILYKAYKSVKIFPFRRKMIQIFLIGLGCSILFYLASKLIISRSWITLFIFGIIYLLVYFGLIIVSRSLDDSDWGIVRAIIKKALSFKNHKLSSK